MLQPNKLVGPSWSASTTATTALPARHNHQAQLSVTVRHDLAHTAVRGSPTEGASEQCEHDSDHGAARQQDLRAQLDGGDLQQAALLGLVPDLDHVPGQVAHAPRPVVHDVVGQEELEGEEEEGVDGGHSFDDAGEVVEEGDVSGAGKACKGMLKGRRLMLSAASQNGRVGWFEDQGV